MPVFAATTNDLAKWPHRPQTPIETTKHFAGDHYYRQFISDTTGIEQPVFK